MIKLNRCFTNTSLPYDSVENVTKMMIKLFEQSPFLAMLPNVSEKDTVEHHTFSHIPCLYKKDKRLYIDIKTKDAEKKLKMLDTAFNNPTEELLEKYAFDAVFLPKFLQIIERIKPMEAVVSLVGPFSMSQRFSSKEGLQLLTDKVCRKLIIQAICVKAKWIINKIKEVSPRTVPIIILEEPFLYKAGDVKRENEEVTNDVIVNLFSKVIAKINEAGAYACVQSFEKCDWTIPIEAGVDIISFDAYNNPNNLNVMAEKVNTFLVNGGTINWGIVPTRTETLVKSLSSESLYDRLIKTMEAFMDSGASERLTYNNSMVSLVGSVDKLSLIFAEKALIMSTQIAKKIPTKTQ